MNLLEKEELIHQASIDLEKMSAGEVISWAVGRFPNLVLACSFGAEDVVLVDILSKISPSTNIFYLDTDLHFKETYETRDRLEDRYGIRFIQVKPKLTLEEQEEQFGAELWSSNPNQCCSLRKVDPLTSILAQYEAWITGIRRDQAPTRANAKKIEYDTKFGLVKFNPLADWSSDDVWQYIREHKLFYNPLHDQNYPSIGCDKCTRPVMPGENPRAGRWSGHQKTECGLHK
ncbi:phosphoadenylyl-sulfate reductase [Paenibacillus senegalensis]|uniref:phosphoadenylyl-sulfate reductase n=1 Tax=Paenibacillus senegalensis TaxID=1465766 RepID=UPI000288D679|nr:phosphoadenylyl-sulfate reductase [Paenibacillus senegalensis]